MKLFRELELPIYDNYHIGDRISFELKDGEPVEAIAVQKENNSMIFCFVDALEQEYRMNRTDSNRGGYKTCELRKNLNGEILDRFPDEIREKMVTFENGDFLRLATEREIFGENVWGEYEDESVQQWEPMKDRRNRIGFQGSKTGTWEWCWLQNKSRNYAAYFCVVYGSGIADNSDASASYGVRPVFKLR